MCINIYVSGSTKCRTNKHDNFWGHNDVKLYFKTWKMTTVLSQYVNWRWFDKSSYLFLEGVKSTIINFYCITE